VIVSSVDLIGLGRERFRLDLYLNRISFQRMVAAVHQVHIFSPFIEATSASRMELFIHRSQ
jgi:hypothetical protein